MTPARRARAARLRGRRRGRVQRHPVCSPLTRQDTNDNGLTTSVTARRYISRYPYRTETPPSRMSSSSVQFILHSFRISHSFRIHSGPGFPTGVVNAAARVPIHAFRFTPAPAPADVLILPSRVSCCCCCNSTARLPGKYIVKVAYQIELPRYTGALRAS